MVKVGSITWPWTNPNFLTHYIKGMVHPALALNIAESVVIQTLYWTVVVKRELSRTGNNLFLGVGDLITTNHYGGTRYKQAITYANYLDFQHKKGCRPFMNPSELN